MYEVLFQCNECLVESGLPGWVRCECSQILSRVVTILPFFVYCKQERARTRPTNRQPGTKIFQSLNASGNTPPAVRARLLTSVRVNCKISHVFFISGQAPPSSPVVLLYRCVHSLPPTAISLLGFRKRNSWWTFAEKQTQKTRNKKPPNVLFHLFGACVSVRNLTMVVSALHPASRLLNMRHADFLTPSLSSWLFDHTTIREIEVYDAFENPEHSARGERQVFPQAEGLALFHRVVAAEPLVRREIRHHRCEFHLLGLPRATGTHT